MPHPPALEAIPTAGSLVGRHLIVREVARGTIGPLFLARTQNEHDVVDTLARVIPIPTDLPPKDDQAIADAIWDSANVGHDMVLRVADVVAGNGWVTLVHDHQVGSLLSSMHWRAGDLGGSFPSDVAARIALDVLEGLEQSRGLCETNRIPWRPGSIAMGSLYLCGDGRTRALDGQVMAAVMRSERMRSMARTEVSIAPEMLMEAHEPDERTDVFAVGAVLWELLTGRELKPDPGVPVVDVNLAVPKDTLVPQGLVHALRRALDLEPDRRQSTLRELAVELVMGAEKVATYEQVVDFAGQLLPFDMAFRKTESHEPPRQETPLHEPPRQETPLHEPPRQETPLHEPPRQDTPLEPKQADLQPTPVETSSKETPTESRHTDPLVNPPPASPREQEDEMLAPAVANVVTPAAAGDALSVAERQNKPDPSVRDGRLEQVDWPEEDAPRAAPIEAAKKSNGARPLSSLRLDADAPSMAKGSEAVGTSPIVEMKSESRAQRTSEPAAKLPRRDSNRVAAGAKAPSTATAHGSVRASSRPTASKAVQATGASGAGRDTRDPKAKPAQGTKSGGFQVSATTLILGFSTTVLAVVLIMILLQQRSTPQAPTLPAPGASAVTTSESALAATPKQAPTTTPELAAAKQASAAPAPTSARISSDVQPGPAEARASMKRSGKTAGAATQPRAPGKDDGASEAPKATKKSGQFIPDEI